MPALSHESNKPHTNRQKSITSLSGVKEKEIKEEVIDRFFRFFRAVLWLMQTYAEDTARLLCEQSKGHLNIPPRRIHKRQHRVSRKQYRAISTYLEDRVVLSLRAFILESNLEGLPLLTLFFAEFGVTEPANTCKLSV